MVVMISASEQTVVHSRLGKAGATAISAFLKKPFELEELLATIERLIGKGEPRNGAP